MRMTMNGRVNETTEIAIRLVFISDTDIACLFIKKNYLTKKIIYQKKNRHSPCVYIRYRLFIYQKKIIYQKKEIAIRLVFI